MISTIIFIVESTFSERDYARFGVDILRRNFDVLILDCTSLLKPHFVEKYNELAFECSGYNSVTSVEQISSLVEKFKNNALVIDIIGFDSNSENIRLILNRFGVPRAILQLGLIPEIGLGSKLSLRNLLLIKDPKAFLRKIFRRTGKLRTQSLTPKIAICSGKAGFSDSRLDGVKHKILAHSFDYDLYLINNKYPALRPGPFAVFLDEDMVYHSNYYHSSIKPPATESAYYGSMLKFFDAFEKNTGMSITVAAHPRASYGARPELWGKRVVVQGKTPQLVRDAAIVLCHQSTSVSFAVLWRKPIIYLTTNELKSSFLGPRIKICSNLLKAPFINVDCSYVIPAIESFAVIDELAYSEYKESYIKLPDTPEVLLWDIVTQYINSEL